MTARADPSDILIGIDAGTSVIKAVAFDLAGQQLAVAATPNRYTTRSTDGAAFQDMRRTWQDCAATLRALAQQVDGLAQRTLAIGVTAQGDGTWLVGVDNAPVTDGWIWLDARADATVRRLRARPEDADRFASTGAGLNVCQMGSQIAHMAATTPDLLARAECALHPKDYLYLHLTGVRATDPSEANFTFGDFRSRGYSDTVIAALGLDAQRHLLPPILDGSQITHPLCAEAAAETGLRAGTPVSLGYVDVVCTALGAGLITDQPAACTIIGSTGMHMRAMRAEEVRLNHDRTGYVMCLPIPGMVAQLQSNMAATLNLDWVLTLAGDLLAEFGCPQERSALIARIDGWMADSTPGALLYHPYISDAGERGPFVNAAARASLIGLNASHRYPDLLRGVIEGLGLAARDCYAAMGDLPQEIRLTGGAARSRALRATLSAATGAATRISSREEAGAAGAAMIAATAIGVYPSLPDCIAQWVTPNLGPAEAPDTALAALYAQRFPLYRAARLALEPVWDGLTPEKDASHV
ncbi:FGGY-family carbohydrate kinase [Gemmobacter fulvus]|uniref:FGGY-family carbohydrate kinase n=1 Tax=Gemmobacter fulvus TaxID=2840474 RepID=UPI0027965C62|nr:FGGY-family carbohydrate kinase [Gemmobacter fulvus]MDQ1849638.1 FGGY-family carbohydrate kinase [Gemmobacter fulvus]